MHHYLLKPSMMLLKVYENVVQIGSSLMRI